MKRRRCALALLLLLTACAGEGDFDAAAHANTVAAWEGYLRAHPDGRRTSEARARIAALREPDDWRKAQTLATVAGYQQYLGDHAEGAHAHDALVAISAATPGPAPADGAAGAAGAAGAPALRLPPAPVSPRKPAPRAADSHDVRVQLGAYAAGESAANDAWRRLRGQHPELEGRSPVIVAGRSADGRPLHRLQIGGLDRAAAVSLCQTLAAGGNPCLVVPASAEDRR